MKSRIYTLLKESSETLSAAESCTGGRISHLITLESGCSSYYLGSVTSYSPALKESILGVNPQTISNKGIVSSAVAAEMAEGVLKLTGSTYSVAITGWADSSGDEFEPAGTAWTAVSGPKGTVTKRLESHLSRAENISLFANQALDFLADYIDSCRQTTEK